MNGKTKRGIQWGAVVTAFGILFGIATYFGCVPVLRSEFAHHMEIETIQRDHIHDDIKVLLRHEGLPHTHGGDGQ